MENNSCIIYKKFLPEETNSRLYNHAVSISENFLSTKLVNGSINESWRKSNEVPAKDFQEFNIIIAKEVQAHLSEVLEQLNIPHFEVEKIETHMTSHNDGEFYKPHIDNTSGNTIKRVITFVYYFHSIPKAFTGGQLLFLRNQPKPLIVEPENNSIVFFNSSLIHAVHPISCPGKRFEDGRFTLNGWIRTK